MSRLDMLAKFGLDTSDFDRGITSVGSKADSIGARFGSLGAKIGGAFAVGAVARFAVNTMKGAMDAADALSDMSALTGASTDALQALSMAAKETGSSMEPIEKALVTIKKNAGDAVNGNKALAATFLHFGITIDDLKSKDPAELLSRIEEQLQASGNAGTEFSRAFDLIGKSVKDLDEVFGKLAANGGLSAYFKKLKDAGMVLSPDIIKQLSDAKEQIAKLEAQLDVKKTTISGNALLLYKNLAPVSMGGFTKEEMDKRDPILGENWKAWEKQQKAKEAAAQELADRNSGIAAIAKEEEKQLEEKRKAAWGDARELNTLLEERNSLQAQYNYALDNDGNLTAKSLEYQLQLLELQPKIAEAQEKLNKVRAEQASKDQQTKEQQADKEAKRLDKLAKQEQRKADILSGKGLRAERDTVDQFAKIGLFAGGAGAKESDRAYWQKSIQVQEEMASYLQDISKEGGGLQ